MKPTQPAAATDHDHDQMHKDASQEHPHQHDRGSGETGSDRKQSHSGATDVVMLSKATYRKMVQNLWHAAGYNIVAIPLAAGVLANAGILLIPALGAVLMSLSTVVVAINARLLRIT